MLYSYEEQRMFIRLATPNVRGSCINTVFSESGFNPNYIYIHMYNLVIMGHI